MLNRSLKPKADSGDTLCNKYQANITGNYRNNSLSEQAEALGRSNAILVEEHRKKRKLEKHKQDIEDVISKKQK